MSRYLIIDQIRQHPRVTVRTLTEIREVHGNGKLTEVMTEDKLFGPTHRALVKDTGTTCQA